MASATGAADVGCTKESAVDRYLRGAPTPRSSHSSARTVAMLRDAPAPLGPPARCATSLVELGAPRAVALQAAAEAAVAREDRRERRAALSVLLDHARHVSRDVVDDVGHEPALARARRAPDAVQMRHLCSGRENCLFQHKHHSSRDRITRSGTAEGPGGTALAANWYWTTCPTSCTSSPRAAMSVHICAQGGSAAPRDSDPLSAALEAPRGCERGVPGQRQARL